MPFTKTFHGFIENITDTLLIIEACRNGLLPTINRRLIERERSAIKSGTIIVFDESESGIKRWTDGFLWSPSRILGNFLVYRELANRENRAIEDDYTLSCSNSRQPSPNNLNNNDSSLALLHQRERALVGSLTTANTTYNFKKNGLLKKTIRIMVNGNYLHIVSYYNKNDVLNNLLPTPSASPQLACLQISADLMPHLQGFAQPSPSSSNNTSSTMPPLPHHSRVPSSSPTRKRSKSSDEQHFNNNNNRGYLSHHRERSDYSLPQQQPRYSIYNTLLPSQNLDYPISSTTSAPTTAFYNNNSHNSSLSRDYYKSTPFTELPPPLPSSTTFSDYMTTSKISNYVNNKKPIISGGSSTSDPLSPSPSPTPSPPTTLPRVTSAYDRSNNHYFPSANHHEIDQTNNHFEPFHRQRPSLDNY